jgi:hypothetical protein
VSEMKVLQTSVPDTVVFYRCVGEGIGGGIVERVGPAQGIQGGEWRWSDRRLLFFERK